MAFNLGDIFVTFKANTDALKKGLVDVQNLSNKANDAATGITKGFENAVGASKQFALGVGIAGAAAVGFGVLTVKAFTESQDLIAQTNAVLKSTGGIAGVTADQVTKLATAFENQTRFSDESVRSVENLLLTFTSITKDIFPQATATVLDMATALKEDTSSAAIQLGKALQDPVLGVTALRRVGVSFNSAQQEVIKNLVDTGQSAKAQQMILKELSREFGGSAAAAGGTFAGQLERLKNKLNNVEEAIGGIIVNAVQPLVAAISNWIDKAGGAEGIMDKLMKLFERIRPMLPVIAGVIAGGLVPALLASAAAGLANLFWLSPFLVLGGALAYLWTKNKLLFYALAGAVAGFALAVLVVMMPTIISAIAGFTTLAVAVLAATWPFILLGAVIAAGAYLIITHWEELKTFFIVMWRTITKAAGEAWDWIKNAVEVAMNAIWATIKPAVDFIAEYFKVWIAVMTYVFDVIRGIAIVFWNWLYGTVVKPIIDQISGYIQTLIAVFSYVWDAIKGPLGAFWSVLTAGFKIALDWIMGAWGGVADWFGGIWSKLTAGSAGAGKAIGGAFSSAFDGVKNVVTGAVNWLIDRVNSVIHGINNTAGKLPGVPKIGDIPKLFTGASDFGGGLAIIGDIQGQGGEMALLPRGTKVLDNDQSKQMLKGAGAGNVSTAIYGDINIGSERDADYLLARLNRNSQLEGMGVAPV